MCPFTSLIVLFTKSKKKLGNCSYFKKQGVILSPPHEVGLVHNGLPRPTSSSSSWLCIISCSVGAITFVILASHHWSLITASIISP